MLRLLGPRQEALLHLLLRHPAGLMVEDLAECLSITRTAVRQHLAVLERDGFVVRAEFRPTGGRPGQLYRLSDAGRALFPKRYSWFSALVLEAIRSERGSAGLTTWLAGIAKTLVPGMRSRVAGASLPERMEQAASLLGELGYEAEYETEAEPETGIQVATIVATNCPYHDLAQEFPEVCALDLTILEDLVAAPIDHESCMAKGDSCCRFGTR
ncbi:MAG: HTH domain-containing protein [Cyanobacteria bacterium REEB65]|nr:HTH domain-containing protein [Cyanobacteria bacterium REEB65]